MHGLIQVPKAERNFMTYDDGNHLFHYTKFGSALKIIISKTLRFGKFEDMNDIAEVKRDIFANLPPKLVEEELNKYQSISLTIDKGFPRGFAINPLWGHYADKGNGCCLVFNKSKLLTCFKKQFSEFNQGPKRITYNRKYSNVQFPQGNTLSEVSHYIRKDIKSIFFTKSFEWKYEQEYRLLTYSEKEEYLNFRNSLLAVILCLPKIERWKESEEYKMLKYIVGETPILHYTTSFGENILNDEEGNQLYPITGIDREPDLSIERYKI